MGGTLVREFIDFWVENSIHAAEEYGSVGAEQRAAALTGRFVEMAASQGFSKADLENEVGDLANYLRDKLDAANQAEKARRDRK
jgi:hypothetical protein